MVSVERNSVAVTMKFVLVLLATFVACHSSAIPDVTNIEEDRNGILNKYFLYTRQNRNDPQQLRASASSLQSSYLDSSRITAIVVHGHGGGPFTSLNPLVKDSFLLSEDVNVIVVDWEVFAGLNYASAVATVPSIGEGIADFIKFLIEQRKVTLDRLHLVGFDLGAHVVGYTGRALDGLVARITGLDPSASRWGSRSGRLTANDGRYVEIIHTDSDGLLANGIGTALGHVDFYPNGGGYQPGCLFHSCSHDRAWELFSASLTHNHLLGSRCGSSLDITFNTCNGARLLMGNNELVKYGSGRYRVNTGRRYPF